jgi:branched-chain amino acid transport system ATP-binding protein
MSTTAFPDSLRRLSQDHVDMRAALSMLEQEVDSVAQYHAPESDLLGSAVQYFATFPARCHHPVEEMIHGALKARSPLAAAQAAGITQHERIIERIGDLAMMTRNLFLDAPKWRVPFCAAARGFITLKRDHIRDEEKNLFRLGVEHLSADEWHEIERAALDAHARWVGEAMASDMPGLRIDRGARANGSVRRR